MVKQFTMQCPNVFITMAIYTLDTSAAWSGLFSVMPGLMSSKLWLQLWFRL